MKKLLLIVVALAFSLTIHAQETITLVVNGEGTTKEEATANALRSAIEQAFGVFVSANTQILNDEIVKDEIATIASGNIKEYKELGTVTMPDGRKSISLSATVSIMNLISYAKSKGSSTEFAGAVWGMNIKMRKLNAENERMAIDHLLEQLDILSRDMFKIELSTPNPPVKINWDDYKYSHFKKIYSSQPYFLDFNLTYHSTSTCTLFFNLLLNSLQSIALNDDEVKAYKESGEPMYELRIVDNDLLRLSNSSYYMGTDASTYYFRNDIVETIISSISASIRNAILPHWQIVRSSTDNVDEAITFKIKGPQTSAWQSYPKNRLAEWSTTPLVTSSNNEHINIDFLPDMMIGNGNKITTFNIKIGFTEEELSKTTGFKITKREGCDVNDIQSDNEIWCTFHSYSKLERDAKPICTYNAKNRCWIVHHDYDLTNINYYFKRLYNGLTSVTIPNSVTKIDYWALEYCTGLTSFTIPNSVTEIGNGAFRGCTGLTSITIPDSVTKIGEGAFDGCTGLTSITIPNSVTRIGQFAFSNTHPDCVAYVPMGRAEYYKDLLSWADFSGKVVEISPNTHASNQIIEEEEKTKVYSNPSSNQIIEEEKTKVYSNSYDGYTNIRETPSLKGKIIGELRNGPDGAVLISKAEGWSKINCNGVEGYVYTKNLTTSPTEEVTINTDINWINGIWRNDNEQYAYLIFNNGTFAIQSTSGTLAYGTYILKGNDIEFSIKQFLSSMEISKIQRLGIDTSTNRIGQLRKMDFLSESEQYNNTYDLTWTKSQFNALKKEIRALL